MELLHLPDVSSLNDTKRAANTMPSTTRDIYLKKFHRAGIGPSGWLDHPVLIAVPVGTEHAKIAPEDRRKAVAKAAREEAKEVTLSLWQPPLQQPVLVQPPDNFCQTLLANPA